MNNPSARIRPGKIIIAEDDSVNQRLLYYHLKDKSDHLLFASDGLEAIRLFEENRDVCLILMDLRMPGMNGVEATKKIHEMDAQVKIIALSAFAEEENNFDIKKAGFVDYLSKPVRKEILLETVEKYLG